MSIKDYYILGITLSIYVCTSLKIQFDLPCRVMFIYKLAFYLKYVRALMPEHTFQTLAGPLCRSSLTKVCGVCRWTCHVVAYPFLYHCTALERSAFVPVLLVLCSTVFNYTSVALDTRTRLTR